MRETAEMLCTQVCSRVPGLQKRRQPLLVAHVGYVVLDAVPRTSGTSGADQSHLALGLQDYSPCSNNYFPQHFKSTSLVKHRASVTLTGL